MTLLASYEAGVRQGAWTRGLGSMPVLIISGMRQPQSPLAVAMTPAPLGVVDLNERMHPMHLAQLLAIVTLTL